MLKSRCISRVFGALHADAKAWDRISHFTQVPRTRIRRENKAKISCPCEAVAASRCRRKCDERAIAIGGLGSKSSCNSEAGSERDFAKHYKNSVLSKPETSKIVVWRSATLRKNVFFCN